MGTSTDAAPAPRAEPPARTPQKVLGVRIDALLEVIAALALLWVVDRLWGSGERFVGVWPHPCWVVVLLTASYYGTREGLAAVLLCSAFVLVHTSRQALPLQVTLQPLAWGIAALVFGEIRDGWRRRSEVMREELDDVRGHVRSIAQDYARLQREKEHLESRVAGQLRTVNSMYEAARAIQKRGVGDVLMGVSSLVHAVLAPEKFSLFLLNGARLEAAICEGWPADDPGSREFDESSPLYHAVVFERRHLAVVNTGDEPILRGEGILAGPVIDGDTGGIIGMLKIEGIRYLDLHLASVQNFRILCEWIGSALAQAQQIENLDREAASMPARRLHNAAEFATDRTTFNALAGQGMLSVRTLYLAIEPPAPAHRAGAERRARLFAAVAQQLLGPQDRCYQTGDGEWPYAVMLPGSTVKAAKELALQFSPRLAEVLGDGSVHLEVRHRIESTQKSRE